MQNIVQWWHYVRKNCGSVSCHLHLGSDTIFLNAHFAAQVSIIIPNNFHTTVTSKLSHTMPSNMTYVSRTGHNSSWKSCTNKICRHILFYKFTHKKTNNLVASAFLSISIFGQKLTVIIPTWFGCKNTLTLLILLEDCTVNIHGKLWCNWIQHFCDKR